MSERKEVVELIEKLQHQIKKDVKEIHQDNEEIEQLLKRANELMEQILGI